MILTFEKEQEAWFVVLPAWKDSKGELQMVAGADKLLDKLSGGKNKVSIRCELEYFKGALAEINLDRIQEIGADYIFTWYDDLDSHELWLCPVMLFVFNEYPEQLHLQIL